jgi:hypothetical protein
MCRLSWNLEASTSWNPQGLSRPVMWLHFCSTCGMKAQGKTKVPEQIPTLMQIFYPVNTICTGKKEVKCTLIQAFKLCTGRTAHRGSRGIALLFHDHGTRKGWGVSVTPRPLFTPGNDSVPIVQEAGWAPGPVWTGAENLASSVFDPRTVQPVASRHYRLSYPAHTCTGVGYKLRLHRARTASTIQENL